MRTEIAIRIGAIGLLSALLLTTFVVYAAEIGHGNGPPHDADELGERSEQLVGEQVELSGDVIEPDPVRIRVEHDDGQSEFTITNAPDTTEGQQLTLVGTLTTPDTIEADRDRSFTRDPWEIQYMYVISILGAALVAARISNEWRFNRQAFQFEPRKQTLLDRYRGGRDG